MPLWKELPCRTEIEESKTLVSEGILHRAMEYKVKVTINKAGEFETEDGMSTTVFCTGFNHNHSIGNTLITREFSAFVDAVVFRVLNARLLFRVSHPGMVP